jgi:hypothetical protein
MHAGRRSPHHHGLVGRGSPDVGSVTDLCSLLQPAKALYSIPPKIESYFSFKICFIIKGLLGF